MRASHQRGWQIEKGYPARKPLKAREKEIYRKMPAIVEHLPKPAGTAGQWGEGSLVNYGYPQDSSKVLTERQIGSAVKGSTADLWGRKKDRAGADKPKVRTGSFAQKRIGRVRPSQKTGPPRGEETDPGRK